jgi:hypothetical protein
VGYSLVKRKVKPNKAAATTTKVNIERQHRRQSVLFIPAGNSIIAAPLTPGGSRNVSRDIYINPVI